MSVFEYRRGKALNDVLEVVFFCATALFLIIIITCNLLELETTETVQKLLKNRHNSTSIKKLNYFRFVVFSIIYLPVFFIKDPFVLQLVSGVITFPTISFIIPVI